MLVVRVCCDLETSSLMMAAIPVLFPLVEVHKVNSRQVDDRPFVSFLKTLIFCIKFCVQMYVRRYRESMFVGIG